MGLNDTVAATIVTLQFQIIWQNGRVSLHFANVGINFFITLLPSEEAAPPLPHLVICCSSWWGQCEPWCVILLTCLADILDFLLWREIPPTITVALKCVLVHGISKPSGSSWHCYSFEGHWLTQLSIMTWWFGEGMRGIALEYQDFYLVTYLLLPLKVEMLLFTLKTKVSTCVLPSNF